jgi:uncharacterized protein (DUF1697 family)
MPRFVALFRGINVGKAKRIAMADLRVLLEGMGFSGVRTLLNSGNAVFDGPAVVPTRHAQRIQTAVSDELGVDALVIVKSASDIAAVITGNKLGAIATDPARLLVALTKDSKGLAALISLAKAGWGSEKVHVGKHAAYIWCPRGILQSKAAPALMKGLAESGTTRNWSTMEKINSLLKSDT